MKKLTPQTHSLAHSSTLLVSTLHLKNTLLKNEVSFNFDLSALRVIWIERYTDSLSVYYVLQALNLSTYIAFGQSGASGQLTVLSSQGVPIELIKIHLHWLS